MKRASFNKRRDANERPIIAALRAAGATVEQLSGPDVPDLLVGFRGANYLLEVKTEKGKMSDGQTQWAREWRGGGVWLVRDVEDALLAIGIRAKETG